MPRGNITVFRQPPMKLSRRIIFILAPHHLTPQRRRLRLAEDDAIIGSVNDSRDMHRFRLAHDKMMSYINYADITRCREEWRWRRDIYDYRHS